MRILIRATNWVGDAVMSIPALEAVRRRWPDSDIAILARPWVADLYRGQGYADRLIVFDHGGRHAGLGGVERLASELRREQFDTALLLQNAFEAAWIAWRAGIKERVGYARDSRSWLLTHPLPVPQPSDPPAHETYYYLKLLRRAGWLDALPDIEHIRLRVEESAREHAELALAAAGVRPRALRVALAPGAAYGSAKCWPPLRFAALADRLVSEFDADVIIFGAGEEAKVAACIASAMMKPPVVLTGRTKIGDLPALLAACDIFIGNDAGAMHVAAAVGRPVVAIFGPTDPCGTRPLTPRATLVRVPVSCSPCFLRHCPVDHRCMARIDLETVFAAARGWITKRRAEGG